MTLPSTPRRVADAASLDDDEGAEPDAVAEQPWAAVEARRAAGGAVALAPLFALQDLMENH